VEPPADPPDDHHGPQRIAEDVAQPRRELGAVAMDSQTNRDSANREREIAEPQRGRRLGPSRADLPEMMVQAPGRPAERATGVEDVSNHTFEQHLAHGVRDGAEFREVQSSELVLACTTIRRGRTCTRNAERPSP